MGALRMQIRIVQCRLLRVPRESANKTCVRSKLWRTSIKLPRVAQHHPGSPMHRLNDASHVHIRVSVLIKLADLIPILRQAQNSESALLVESFGRADIKKTCTVTKFNYVIDMC